MRRAGRGCLVTLGLVVGIGVIAAVFPTGTLTPRVGPIHRGEAGAGMSWLSSRGGRVVDQQGRSVLLRGYNVESLLEYPERAAAPLDEVDAALMAKSGATVVRVPVSWSLIEPVRGQYDSGYIDRVATAVRMLERHNLYVVLDMHFYPNWGPRFGGAGAPRWAYIPGIPDAAFKNDLARKNLSPAANFATTYFWMSDDWQSDYQQSWRRLAARFVNDPGVAGYDLYNEPRPLPLPPALFEKYWMWPLMSRTIEAVASVDPNHLFVVESTLWLDQPTLMVKIDSPNLVYSPHVYTGSLVPPAFDGNPAALAGVIRQRVKEANYMGAALWTGELGIDHHSAHAAEWADAILGLSDDVQAGWAWWQWRQADRHWGIRDAAGTEVDVEFLRHISRPFLAAAPTGVVGGRGDGVAGTLDITVSGGHAAGVAEVSWPGLTLAAPGASGSCLTSSRWDAAADRLYLELAPGAACTVRVRARPA